MSKRVMGVALLALLLLSLMALPALAVEDAEEEGGVPSVEEQEPLPDIDSIGTQNETSRQFFPEAYEEPSLFPPIVYGLLITGAIIALVLLVMYLLWQPRFAQERQKKVKGRR
jgi:hypothetical protein